MVVICSFFLRCADTQKYLLGVLGFLLCISCTNPKHPKTDPGLSVEVEKILKTADTMSAYGHGKQAMIYLDSAYSTLKKPSVKALFYKFSDQHGFYLLVDKDAFKANLYADSMLLVLKGWEHQYGMEYANALFSKGDAVLLGNGYKQAFQYYYDARHFALKNLDRCTSYGFTYRFGLLKYKQERYVDAITYFKQSYAEGNNCNDDQTMTDIYLSRRNCLNSIGICFERIGKLDSAIYYYEKCLKFIDQHPQKLKSMQNFMLTAKAVVYGNMGGIYAKQKQYDKAEKYLKESIRINERPRAEEVDALTAKLKLAELYFKFKHFKQAGNLLNELQLALNQKRPEKEMLTETQMKLYKLQWQFFENTQQMPKAYRHMQLYYTLRDSLEYISHNLKVADVDLVFKNNEQQYKLTLLSKENEVKKSYLIAFVIFSFMAIVTLFILWRNRKRLQLLNTKITRQNADMQKVLTALEQSQEENTRMMKIVAHDLRSPIAAGISIARMLKNSDLPPEDSEMLNLLETSSLHSLEMITDLLNINISSEGLKKEPVEMHTLMRYCVNLLHFKANDKSQELKLTLVEAVIQANREKIWRVVSNLIVNAIKFSPVGAEIEIEMYKTKKEVVIKIKDHGIGIPLDLREKIFNIFTDAKRKGTSGEHSFGLGLAISKQIIEAHRGRIWLESEVDKGSTFFVSLPMDN
jgi:signal transduction histidine kinase